MYEERTTNWGMVQPYLRRCKEILNYCTSCHTENVQKRMLSILCLISLHQETICDANAERKLQNFVSKSGSSPQMHARWQHQIPSMYMLWVGGGGLQNLMLSSNLLKSKIPMLRVGGWGGFAEFDVEFKFAKIQNSYVEGGWVGGVHRIWCWVQIC